MLMGRVCIGKRFQSQHTSNTTNRIINAATLAVSHRVRYSAIQLYSDLHFSA